MLINWKTREMIQFLTLIIVKLLLALKVLASSDRPNLLIMMSDDQSFPHALLTVQKWSPLLTLIKLQKKEHYSRMHFARLQVAAHLEQHS